jgi:hypothetical protein
VHLRPSEAWLILQDFSSLVVAWSSLNCGREATLRDRTPIAPQLVPPVQEDMLLALASRHLDLGLALGCLICFAFTMWNVKARIFFDDNIPFWSHWVAAQPFSQYSLLLNPWMIWA